jgi:hypothetical protein
MNRITKIVVAGGLVGAMIFFGPVIFGILGELLCGGFIVLSPLVNIIGEGGLIAVGALIVFFIFWFVYKKAKKHINTRMQDETLENTHENDIKKIAQYIQMQRGQGKADSLIRKSLELNGWTKEEIDQAFKVS